MLQCLIGLIYLLHSYHTNVTNRLIKAQKLYFLDTGLCEYLMHWSTPAALEAGALSGAILETYLFSVLAKLKQPIGPGALICFKKTDVPLSRELMAIPVGYL